MTEKTCVHCNKNFVPNVGNQKCCSPDCFSAYRRVYCKKNKQSREVERTCKQCGETYKRVYEKSGFCTISCGSKWNLKQGNFEKWRNSSANREPTGQMIPCTYCGVENYRKAHLADVGFLPFCDKRCKGKYFSSQYSGTGNPMFGHKLTVEQKAKQRKTLLTNHGVTNAWTLAKHRTTSRAHQAIFDQLTGSFPDKLFETERVFRSGSHEYYLDIVSEPLKTVVEYNGDYWHCNPKKYAPDFFHQVKKLTAREIWERDAKRLNTLQTAGYSTVVIWENDYHLNPSGTMETLKDFMKKRCVSG